MSAPWHGYPDLAQEEEDALYVTLTRAQRQAMEYLGEVKVNGEDWCGYVSFETQRDRFGPPVHWRTARALQAKGLVRLGEKYLNMDGYYEQEIYLTRVGAFRFRPAQPTPEETQ